MLDDINFHLLDSSLTKRWKKVSKKQRTLVSREVSTPSILRASIYHKNFYRSTISKKKSNSYTCISNIVYEKMKG